MSKEVRARIEHGGELGEYTVETRERGKLVFGSTGINEISGLIEAWSEAGYDCLAPGIAYARDAPFAVTSTDQLESWREAIRDELRDRYPDDPLCRWFAGPDTGMSARTLAVALSHLHRDQPEPGDHYAEKVGEKVRRGVPSVPRDPADLQRCIDVDDLIRDETDWADRVKDVPSVFPEWKPYIQNWDRLRRELRRELLKGDGQSAPETHRFLKDLRGALDE